MTDHDQPIESMPSAPSDNDDQDTEGHSLLSGELGAQIAREHAREAETYVRDQANRRAIDHPRQGLRKRLFGR